MIGSFKSRATDVEAVIPSSYAVVDFGASAYDFLAYTAADPEAIMIQIRSLFGETANWSRTVEEFNEDALSTVSAFLQPMHSFCLLYTSFFWQPRCGAAMRLAVFSTQYTGAKRENGPAWRRFYAARQRD